MEKDIFLQQYKEAVLNPKAFTLEERRKVLTEKQQRTESGEIQTKDLAQLFRDN